MLVERATAISSTPLPVVAAALPAARTRHGVSCPQASAAAPAELGHDIPGLIDDGDVVDAGPPAQRALDSGRAQGLPGVRRLEEGDVGTRRQGHGDVVVAGDRERGVGEREDEAAVGDVVAVHHVVAQQHRDDRVAEVVTLDDHPERGGCAIALHHLALDIRSHRVREYTN